MKETLLTFWQPIEDYVPKIPALILALAIGYLLIKILTIFLHRGLKIVKISRSLSDVLLSLATILLWVLLFSEIARQAGMDSLALTISGSIVVIGLALANGAASLTADIISGIYLAKDHDFDIGYRVKIGEVEGIIRKIDVRKTRIRDDQGKLHVFPNSVVDKGDWTVIFRDLEQKAPAKIDTKSRKK